jgi:hypothetical protein
LQQRDLMQFHRREQKALERLGVLIRAADAETIPDPRFPSSGHLVAVRKTVRGLYAVACNGDEYIVPFPIKEDDIRQYSVSVPHLIEEIRKQNDIDGDTNADVTSIRG